MLRKDQRSNCFIFGLLCQTQSFWEWTNSIWAVPSNSWEDRAAAHPTRTGGSFERCKQSADTEPTIVPGNRATLAHFIKNPSWGRLWANQVNTGRWHHPWASQLVQLKKYLWYQGSRHHLWPVAYALNYLCPEQLSDEVFSAIHSHIKDTVHSFSSWIGYLTVLAQ